MNEANHHKWTGDLAGRPENLCPVLPIIQTRNIYFRTTSLFSTDLYKSRGWTLKNIAVLHIRGGRYVEAQVGLNGSNRHDVREQQIRRDCKASRTRNWPRKYVQHITFFKTVNIFNKQIVELPLLSCYGALDLYKSDCTDVSYCSCVVRVYRAFTRFNGQVCSPPYMKLAKINIPLPIFTASCCVWPAITEPPEQLRCVLPRRAEEGRQRKHRGDRSKAYHTEGMDCNQLAFKCHHGAFRKGELDSPSYKKVNIKKGGGKRKNIQRASPKGLRCRGSSASGRRRAINRLLNARR